jgi:pyocin large subunit-like protein
MFPKKGNNFPAGGGNEIYLASVAAALRAELGESHQAVKTVMRWTGANERTVKNWLAARRGPRGEHLIRLMHHSDTTLEVVLRLAGREQVVAGKTLLEARKVLAKMLQQIDLCLVGRAE